MLSIKSWNFLTNRINGELKGKDDYHYYSPYPELKLYRSLTELMFSNRHIEWKGLNFDEGRYEDNFVHPTFKRYSGRANWNDKELQKRSDVEDRKSRERKERFERREEGGEVFDVANARSIYEMLYFSRGTFDGKYPHSPEMPQVPSTSQQGEDGEFD